MNNAKYQAVIRSATETRNVDFKAAMNWRTASKCEKLEILKDIAAMANAGGGILVIGRDGPLHTTGTLNDAQTQSFDPTEVNKLVHRYLAPSIECRVEIETFEADTLAVIETPEFDNGPIVFQEAGNCSNAACRKRPHFHPGDVFIRTKAQQSQRISDADEMRDLISRAVRKSSAYLVSEMQRMLTSPSSIEEPLPISPYDEILKSEDDAFFRRFCYGLPATAGRFDMTIMPVEFVRHRLELRQVPRLIREFSYVISRNGIFDSVPFEQTNEVENFDGGCRISVLKPEWRRLEAVSLHESGAYRLVRGFIEDYQPDAERTTGKFVETDRELWVDMFVDQMTMFHLLARNITRALATDTDVEFQMDLRISGLGGRVLSANNMAALDRFLYGLGVQKGSTDAFHFPIRITSRELDVQAVNLARERCARILWTFGVDQHVILPLQRKLFGNTEPTALPPQPK